MAFALGIPCCAVSSLEGLAYTSGAEGLICPVMKARQDLVYTALFCCEKGKLSRLEEDGIISVSSLNQLLSEKSQMVILCGDGAEGFYEQYRENEMYRVSPPHIRLQNAAGICLGALNHEKQSPEQIEASYLQLVKAEKDLLKSKSG
jgi:tRNA threonylcarbamoyladenosine biosynthesis protein TsaB